MSVPMTHGSESPRARAIAVVVALAAGLFVFLPFGAVLAFGFAAFWIKDRRTRTWLVIIGIAFAVASSLFIAWPWGSTGVSTGGTPH